MMKFWNSLLWWCRLALLANAGICAATESPAVKPERPPQRLLITVVYTDDAAEVRELLEPDASGGTLVRRWGTRRPRGQDNSVQVQVLEGRTAFVHLGQTIPDVQLLGVEGRHRRPVPYVRLVSREYNQGFYVQAELAGNNVVLNLYRYSDMPRTESVLSSTRQELRTTVSGRIGQWLDAGGALDISRDRSEPSAAVRTYSVWHGDEDATRLLIRAELSK